MTWKSHKIHWRIRRKSRIIIWETRKCRSILIPAKMWTKLSRQKVLVYSINCWNHIPIYKFLRKTNNGKICHRDLEKYKLFGLKMNCRSLGREPSQNSSTENCKLFNNNMKKKSSQKMVSSKSWERNSKSLRNTKIKKLKGLEQRRY